MTTIQKASELIENNNTSVVLFTRGFHFSFDPASINGESGNWVLNPDMLESVDQVIVYLRRNNEKVNRIFLGKFAGFRSSGESRRFVVRFSGLREVGVTDSNWLEFSDGSTNPVRYISR